MERNRGAHLLAEESRRRTIRRTRCGGMATIAEAAAMASARAPSGDVDGVGEAVANASVRG